MSAPAHGETPLFQGLSLEQIEEFSSWLVRMEFVLGQEIISEGSESDGLYVLARGSVEVLKQTPSGATRIGEWSSPSVFGEMAMLNQESHSASVRAVTRVTAGFLSQQVYEQRLSEDNAIALRISLNLGKVACQRLRATTQRMLHLSDSGGAVEPPCAPARQSQPELKNICTRFLKGGPS